MRSVTYSMGVSLDGYIVGPDGDITAPPPSGDITAAVTEPLADLALLWGLLLAGAPFLLSSA